MQRREFLAASAAALGAAALPAAAADNSASKQILELRIYHLASAERLKAYDDFLASTGVAALNRAGVEPVGIFQLHMKDNAALKLEQEPLDLYVLLPHKSFDSFLQLEAKLAADETYQKAGQAILMPSGKTDAAYVRYDSTVMLAFDGVPQVQVPSKAAQRLLQLRIYESPNNERAKKKVQMFNTGGELAIFHRCGMTPVFFGESLAGGKLPNLTYMLAFDDEAQQTKAWNAFRGDAEWKKLSKDEAYKDVVSNITNLILRPGAGSQI